MALPLLKDFLPEPDLLPKPGPRPVPELAPGGTDAARAQALASAGQRLAALQKAIGSYIQRVRSARPSPEEVEAIFKDFVSGQAEYLEYFRKKQIRLLRDAIALFESAERDLLALRDEALIEETQAAFGSRFWDDEAGFLDRIAKAPKSLREGNGVRLENLEE